VDQNFIGYGRVPRAGNDGPHTHNKFGKTEETSILIPSELGGSYRRSRDEGLCKYGNQIGPTKANFCKHPPPQQHTLLAGFSNCILPLPSSTSFCTDPLPHKSATPLAEPPPMGPCHHRGRVRSAAIKKSETPPPDCAIQGNAGNPSSELQCFLCASFPATNQYGYQLR